MLKYNLSLIIIFLIITKTKDVKLVTLTLRFRINDFIIRKEI